MSKETDRSLADFVAGALSPPLIMALVGSLVFFLLEILYQGVYRSTLQWVFFFFIFGAVLVIRIAMRLHAGLAGGYGLVLGGLTWLALLNYVEYSPQVPLSQHAWAVNLGLIILIWWSVGKLTWDCTLLDNKFDREGKGLLQASGLDPAQTPAAQTPAGQTHVVDSEDEADGKKKKKKRRPSALSAWWQRYLRHRERKREEPHTPGVWVVYFSLAALPLFGLGQAQINPADTARHRYVFYLLVIYVGAGMGLLLTTSYLGLRSYLRSRKVTMPAQIAFVWLILGGILVAVLLAVSDLLPRPNQDHPYWAWTGLMTSRERDPSKLSPFKEGKEDPSKGTPEEKGGAGAKGASTAKKGTPSKEGKQGQAKADPSQKGPLKGEAKGNLNQQSANKKKVEGEGGKQSSSRSPPQPKSNTPPASTPFAGLFELVLKVLRWLLIAAVVLVVLFVLGRALLHFLANFTFWARGLLDFFRKLFTRPEKAALAAEPMPARTKMPARPFASFTDPFESGKADFLSQAELIRYTFAALEAWARERDLARESSETPIEFCRRLGKEFAGIKKDARQLGLMYARLAYSTDSLPKDSGNHLRSLWRGLAKLPAATPVAEA